MPARFTTNTTLPALLFVTIATLVVATVWQNLYYLTDLGETVYLARLIANGKVPYRDFFNHHFAGYLVPFVLVELLIGLTPCAIALMQIIAISIYALTTALSVRLITNDRLLFILAGILATTAGTFPIWVGLTFNYQSYTAPLIALQLTALVKCCVSKELFWLKLAAIVFGFALTFDQRVIVFGPVLIVPLLTLPELRRLGNLTKLSCYALCGPVIFALLILYFGVGSEFLEQTINFPLFQRNAGFAGSPVERWLILMQKFCLEPIAMLSLVALPVFLILEQRSAIKLLLISTAIASLAYVMIGGRSFFNYLLMLGPIISLLVSCLPFYLKRMRIVSRGMLVALAVLIPLSFISIWKVKIFFEEIANTSVLAKIAQSVKSNSNPNQDLLVWGYCPQLYLYSERVTSLKEMGLLTIAGSVFHLSPPSEKNVVPSMLESFKKYLQDSPPHIVVARKDDDPKNVFSSYQECIFGTKDLESLSKVNFFREYLQNNYEEIGSFQDPVMVLGVYKYK